MTSFPALRRDLADPTTDDEERSAVEGLVLPLLPKPSRAALAVLAFFARSEPLHLITPTSRFLH
ncbi:hypothetical protein ASG43_10535 [Aureimonas sp. Leaf454]|uniref:hypothetical protein n=1 Tax=Aureimonas sp. Leaf454 TaxID=1736381 RepID=UPI0006FB1CA7|nr:hypothetical protein [Aureimonas sp. Leaf454]KQT47518.1 hypothetical protein ASG43_10535 [Aureimonas sp. Leaf454]